MIREPLSLLRLWTRLAFRAAPVLGSLRVLTAVLAAVLLPFATLGAGQAVDGLFAGQAGQARGGVLLISAWLVAELFATVGRTVIARTMDDLSDRYVNTSTLDVLARIPTLEYRYDPRMADDISVVREKARELGGGAQQLTALLSTVVGAVSVGAVLASVSPWLLVIIPAAVVPVWAAGRLTNRRLEAEHANRWAVRRADLLLELARDADQAMEMRCNGAGPAVVDAIRDGLHERRVLVAEVTRQGRTMAIISRLVFLLLCAVLVFILFAQVRAGSITTGDLIVVVLLLPAIEALVGNFQHGALQVVDAWRGLRIYRRIERYAQDHDGHGGRPGGHADSPARLERGIVLDGVSFTYPRAEHPAVRDVDLHLEAGEVVALVGENGAGKSTLVALLARLLDPVRGTITIDGERLADLDVDSWRSHATAAFQDHVNLQLAARMSVGVGDLRSCDEPGAVYRALDKGAARDIVDALPAGLATQLGRDFCDGVDLSGGQWQRLAIARGMMRPEPLLTVLDEPTSALDPDAEALILGKYVVAARSASARAGGVSVIVTHRMSTARLADRILFLENGRIVEDGDHDTLVARGGRYAELFDVQARGYR